MAARKDSTNLTHSQLNAGDMLCCTPCTKKSLHKKVSKYCVNCKQYFCISCVENHNSFTSLSGHVLVDPNATETSSKSTGQKLTAVPTELCKIHTLELVNMYCGDDDVVGCSVCFTMHHKSCSNIRYIPDYVQSNFTALQINRINKNLTEAIEAMKQLKTQHDRLDEHLYKSKDICKHEIQKYRDEINQIFDKIEAATLTELDAEHKDAKKKTEDIGQTIKNFHDEMIKFKSEIESDQNNCSQKFVIAKLSQDLLKQSQELQSALHHQSSELIFTRNTDIMTFLFSIISLGIVSPPVLQDSISSTATISNKQETESSVSPSASAENRNNNTQVSTRQQDTQTAMEPLKQHLYKLEDKSEYIIQQPCGIRSSCILDNGNILLVDFNNNELKLVDNKTYTVTSSLVLDASPVSVCRISSTEAAVCLGNKTIQFVSTCDTLVPVRSFSMEHFCECIAAISDMVYVCDSLSVYIYTVNGILVQAISKDKSGNHIFSSIHDISVSDDGMIHVADRYSGVNTLNTDGNLVWRYSGTKLRTAWGVCIDGNGNVIVCGHKSNNVIQLAPDGQYMGEIVTRSDGVKNPQSVCYDRNNQKLIIGHSTNTMTVLTIK